MNYTKGFALICGMFILPRFNRLQQRSSFSIRLFVFCVENIQFQGYQIIKRFIEINDFPLSNFKVTSYIKTKFLIAVYNFNKKYLFILL